MYFPLASQDLILDKILARSVAPDDRTMRRICGLAYDPQDLTGFSVTSPTGLAWPFAPQAEDVPGSGQDRQDSDLKGLPSRRRWSPQNLASTLGSDSLQRGHRNFSSTRELTTWVHPGVHPHGQERQPYRHRVVPEGDTEEMDPPASGAGSPKDSDIIG